MKRKTPRTIRSMTGPQRTAVIAFLWGQSWGFGGDPQLQREFLEKWIGDFFRNEPISETIRGHLEIIRKLADISYSGRMPKIEFPSEKRGAK